MYKLKKEYWIQNFEYVDYKKAGRKLHTTLLFKVDEHNIEKFIDDLKTLLNRYWLNKSIVITERIFKLIAYREESDFDWTEVIDTTPSSVFCREWDLLNDEERNEFVNINVKMLLKYWNTITDDNDTTLFLPYVLDSN